MPTVGRTDTPTSAPPTFGGLNTRVQVGMVVTMPENGRITNIACYCWTDGVALRLCIWRASDGALLAATGDIPNPGVEGWKSSGIGPLDVAGGTQLIIGWWRGPTGTGYWRRHTTGGHRTHDTSSTAPTTFVTTETLSGDLGAYITYTTGTVMVRRSGGWTARVNPRVRRSGTWVEAPARVRRSGTWVTP